MDQKGNFVWKWDHDPFGNGAPNQKPGKAPEFVYNLRFPGQYYDSETGLFYNMARDYDPKTGRYIQYDPIGLKGGINPYVYVENNPLTLIDPMGLDVYVMNRELSVLGGAALPVDKWVSHALTFTTNSDGSIAHTFSWGNDANLKGWNLDQMMDRLAANQALQEGKVLWVAPDFLVPYLMDAFNQLNRPEFEHGNGYLYDNCKVESRKLRAKAWQLWTTPKFNFSK
jgi:RHS repeat-associated protein